MHSRRIPWRGSVVVAAVAAAAWAVIVVVLLAPSAARAATEYQTTYVAGVGGVNYADAGDGNNCSQESTPCATLDGAFAQTASGGTVYVSGTVIESSAADTGNQPNDPMTIAANPGGSSATIAGDPQDTDGLLDVESDSPLTLRGLAFQDGVGDMDGGAITNNDGATLTIDDSSFIDNRAEEESAGGAIENAFGVGTTGALTISGSTFVGNTAGSLGGAIESGSVDGTGTVSISDSSFSDNTTAGSGGAIDSGDDGGTGDLTISGSSFTDNKANGTDQTAGVSGGGAITSGDTHGTGTVTVTDSTFSGNTAAASGGAILSGGYEDNGANLAITGSTFTDNSATGDGEDDGGGAIESGDEDGTASAMVTDSTFTANTDAGDGGAIDSGDFGGTGILGVTDSTFEGNAAAHEDGGAIDSGDEGGNGILTVTGSTLAGNTSGIDGGAVDNGDRHGDGTATVLDSTFAGNTAPGYEGGAIDNGDDGGTGNLTAVYSTFSGNTASPTPPASQGATIANAATSGSGTTYLAADVLDGSCWQAGGSWVDDGFNVSTSSTCLGDPAGAGDAPVSSAAAELGSLADNGGTTQTMELLTGNASIGLIPQGTSLTVHDGATNPTVACPVASDQRGDASASSGGCDAGAVQYAAQSVSFTSTAPTRATAGGTSYTPTASSTSGLSVSYALDPNTTNSACSVSGDTVSFDHAGTCVIDAIGSGTTNFAAAKAQQTIPVAGAPSTGTTTTTSATTTTTPGTTTTTPGTTTIPSPLVRVLAGSGKVSNSRLSVRLSCSAAACAGVVKIELTTVMTVRHGKKSVRKQITVVLGSGHFSLATGRTSTVEVGLNATGRHDLTTARDHRLSVNVVAAATHGNQSSRRETIQMTTNNVKR